MTGEELKALRQGAGMTQQQAAEALGLKGPNVGKQISAWERGRYAISRYLATALQSVLTPKK